MIRAKDELDALNRYLADSVEPDDESDEYNGCIGEYQHNADRMIESTKKLVKTKKLKGMIE